ncbi:hypothetical protein T12_16887 [Trichinella patagoniensis]|uniref:Uncharacterized protein n=1 Tax=Trichinella patagoniensis TaxID=990121 RepID=A0A0V0ZRH0_9BILA|nr:hypothetical protein T12_16887 [Trichinella patagoniensis]
METKNSNSLWNKYSVGALFLQHPSQLDESRTADVKQKEKIRYNIQIPNSGRMSATFQRH